MTAQPFVNPVLNLANITVPGGTSGNSNVVSTMIAHATVSVLESVDKAYANINVTLTYTLTLTNNGNAAPLAPGGSATIWKQQYRGHTGFYCFSDNREKADKVLAYIDDIITFQVTVTAVPNLNPIANTMTAAFTYTVNTVVFRDNYSQEISDLIHSIALQEAAIGNMANAEGGKIQRMLSMGADPNELLCVNKSVSDMLEVLGTLESILKQKLSLVDCQISPYCM